MYPAAQVRGNDSTISHPLGLYLVATLVFSACGTTPAKIHAWGAAKQYDRIRQALVSKPTEELRIAAALELGKGDNVFGITDLVRLSQDPSPQVRLTAVEALGSYAGAEVYTAIIQRLGDDNADVARSAERILGTWGPESIDVVLQALSNSDYRVRASAVQMLTRMKDERIGPALIERARLDDNIVVRREAVRGLGNIAHAPAKPLLYKLKHTDPAKEVALEAEQALAKLGGKITTAKVALLLPFRTAPKAAATSTAKAAKLLAERLTLALFKANLCEVLQGAAPLEDSPDYVKLALAGGRDTQAEQILIGRVEATGPQLTVTVSRYAVGDGALIQEETQSGLESELTALIDGLVAQLLRRFIG